MRFGLDVFWIGRVLDWTRTTLDASWIGDVPDQTGSGSDAFWIGDVPDWKRSKSEMFQIKREDRPRILFRIVPAWSYYPDKSRESDSMREFFCVDIFIDSPL